MVCVGCGPHLVFDWAVPKQNKARADHALTSWRGCREVARSGQNGMPSGSLIPFHCRASAPPAIVTWALSDWSATAASKRSTDGDPKSIVKPRRLCCSARWKRRRLAVDWTKHVDGPSVDWRVIVACCRKLAYEFDVLCGATRSRSPL